MAVPHARTEFDVAIVGGGPAGQAAALTLTDHGLSVAVIDEQLRPGGQILRQPPQGRAPGKWLHGSAYRHLQDLLSRFEAAAGVTWIGRSSVIGIQPAEPGGFAVQIASTGAARELRCRCLLIATGCYDMPVPLPGWTQPGVMSVGAVQTLLKGQGVVAGKRILLAGTHPLLLIAARQLQQAGADVAGVLFAQSLSAMLRILARHPMTVLRHAGIFGEAARAFLGLRRGGVAVRFATSLSRIEGEEGVTQAIAGNEPIACDTVALGYGFLPQSDLPRLTGAAVCRADPVGGWRALHDEWMRSSVPGLYVAGETTGVKGAEAALESGTIAAAGILAELGKIDPATANRLAQAPRRRLKHIERFARLFAELADPTDYLPPIDQATVICRCETVTAAAIEAELAHQPGPASPNALKLASRAGMGLCQGRGCEHTVLRMLEQARIGPEKAFAVQFPARPVAIRDLIGLAPDATETLQDHH